MYENSASEDQIAKLTDMIRHYQSVEASLRESRDINTTILQRSFAAIYVVQDGKFCNVNIKATANSGYSIEELIGMNADSLVHPEDKTDVLRRSRAMLCGESTTPYAFRILTKQGDVRWIMETVSVITYGGRPAILGNSMDITEHRQAIERLQNSENLYRAIFETTLAATIIIEEDTTISLVNSEFSRMSGYSRDEWEGKKSWTEFVIPEDRERMKSYHQLRRIDPKAAPRDYEFGFIDRQGRIRNVILMVDMIPETRKSLASFIDITDHKRAVAQLEESENLYRTIFETTGTATIVIEQDTTISMINNDFSNFTGYLREEILGHTWTMYVAEDDVDRLSLYHKIRRENPTAAPRNYEFKIRKKDGELLHVFMTIAMIPGTTQSIASMVDITAIKQLEKEVLDISERERQKIGYELHDDLGQHLIGIDVMTKVLHDKLLPLSDENARYAGEINKLVKDAIEKTRRLARGLCPVHLTSLGLEASLEELATSTSIIFNMTCDLRCPRHIPISDNSLATHLYYIAKESIHNAIEHGKSSKIVMELLNNNGIVSLSILDNGVGIKDTTKVSGIGLRIMHYRARMIGASLRIESEQSGGTLVTCTFNLNKD